MMNKPEYSGTLASRFERPRRFTAGALSLSIILIAYGLMCRLTHLYFFWESLKIGAVLLPVAFIAILFGKLQQMAALDQSRTGEKVGIGFFLFILFIQVLLLATIPFTDAYKEAGLFLLSDESLVKELGPVDGFSVLPMGSVQTGNAKGCTEIYMTVKGVKKYKDCSITLVRDKGGPWRVTEDEAEIQSMHCTTINRL